MSTGSILLGNPGAYTTGFQKTWSGSNDPLRQKWNPYHMSLVSTRAVIGEIGTCGISLHNPPQFTANDEIILLNKLADSVRKHEFNAGVFVGQAGELSRQIVGTATALVGVARSLKRGDFGQAIRFLVRSPSGVDKRIAFERMNSQDIAGAYLALRYGWLPLLSDVHDAAKAFAVMADPPRTSKVSASRNLTSDYEGSQSEALYSCPGTSKRGKRYTVVLTENLSYARSMGLADPLPIIHELTPWSFVADWFIPIGDYLSALAIIPHLRGSCFIQEKTHSRISGCQVFHWHYSDSNASGKSVTFDRYAEGAMPSVPLPQFKGFDRLWSSATRVGDAIALLRTVFH